MNQTINRTRRCASLLPLYPLAWERGLGGEGQL